MRLVAIALATIGTAATGWGHIAPPTSENRVLVCLEDSHRREVFFQAERLASVMFARVGVNVEWRSTLHACLEAGDQAIVIHLLEDTPAGAPAGAMARGFPVEGVRIDVFLDRVATTSGLDSSILAHVFVHEIAHIVQGVPRHSSTGIMKASWSSVDFARMHGNLTLPFSEEDVRLIFEGLSSRAEARRERAWKAAQWAQ